MPSIVLSRKHSIADHINIPSVQAKETWNDNQVSMNLGASDRRCCLSRRSFVCCVTRELCGTWGGSHLNHTGSYESDVNPVRNTVWVIKQIVFYADWKWDFGLKTFGSGSLPLQFCSYFSFHFVVFEHSFVPVMSCRGFSQRLNHRASHFTKSQHIFPWNHGVPTVTLQKVQVSSPAASQILSINHLWHWKWVILTAVTLSRSNKSWWATDFTVDSFILFQLSIESFTVACTHVLHI